MLNFKENVSLAEYTTFKIGGPAKYFFRAKTKQDLIKAVQFAKKEKLPFFILGGGSNLLVSDKGFAGMVILMNNKRLEIDNNKIITEAGAKLSDIVKASIKNNLTGLEWAIGIPGTIGGAIKVNAHAFGFNISELVRDIKKDNNIIFSVELELKKGGRKESNELIKEYIKRRENSQPLEYPSAGCIFRNIPGHGAGRLIDKAGLKGVKIGQAMISDKHANFIINLGGAKAEDIVKLINLVKKAVKDKFEINLKEEINYLGF